MRSTLLLISLLGCVSSSVRSGVDFRLIPTPNDSCVWVERHDYEVSMVDDLASSIVDTTGQLYLYYCCPTEPGAPPVCLNPRWEAPSNSRRPLPSLEELEKEERRRRRQKGE